MASVGAATYIPFLRMVTNVALYETKANYYIIGSDPKEEQYRVLKVDRGEPRKLELSEDPTIYNFREMRNLLQMIFVGNRSKIGQKVGAGFHRSLSAWGILGFVRFLEGYYIVLIVKRRKCGNIGFHDIFKVEETQLVYIPSDTKEKHPDEQRYVKTFQSFDLRANFYYSYSYDLSHSLQYNLRDPRFLLAPTASTRICLEDVPELSSGNYSYVPEYQSKFVWNEYLLQGTEHLSPGWCVPIIHGFVDQANISIYGRAVILLLIARRSNRYAGTRFLKRGANFDGDAANEVETEQIVCDGSIGSDKVGHYTSFVQVRGSVPAQWGQDSSKIQPRPPILIELQEPFGETAGKHFNDLMGRFGSPVVVINLVRKKEKIRKYETILSEEYIKQVRYLNQFLPEKHWIQYIPFDMARCRKSKKYDVMTRLELIAYKAIKQTGIFHNRPTLYLHLQDSWTDPHTKDMVAAMRSKCDHLLNCPQQTGIIRTNCVDCLDRTNTAQLVIGKCALAFQLHALGVLNEPRLMCDTDCVRILEEMYNDQGDTLALQYGGSQLIHRVNTYRKKAPWTSRGNDIMQTLRRYYSNALSDAEKQMAMNVFLGIFRPDPTRPPIWEKENNADYYIHLKSSTASANPLSQWWSAELMEYLPYPRNQHFKTCTHLVKEQNPYACRADHYRDFELSTMQQLFLFSEVHHSVRDQMPNNTTDFSPFSVRIEIGKKKREMSSKQANLFLKNPSVAGNSSSTEEYSSDTADSYSSDSEVEAAEQGGRDSEDNRSERVTFAGLFPTMEAVYGVTVHQPADPDVQSYKSYSSLSREAGPFREKVASSSAVPHPLARPVDRLSVCPIPVHDYSAVLFPTISEKSKQLYTDYVQVGRTGAHGPSSENLAAYTRYVDMFKSS